MLPLPHKKNEMAFHKLGCSNILAQQSGGVTVSAPAGPGWRKRGRWNDRGAECHLLGVARRAPASRRGPPPSADAAAKPSSHLLRYTLNRLCSACVPPVSRLYPACGVIGFPTLGNQSAAGRPQRDCRNHSLKPPFSTRTG